MPGTTVNRLCGSGMDAIGIAARAIKSGEASLMIAGGVESMSRAPFVHGQGDLGVLASGRDLRHDDRLALRQSADEEAVRRRLDAGDGRERRGPITRSAAQIRIAFALRSQQKAARAQQDGTLAQEIVAVTIAQKKGDPVVVAKDEHPRETTLEALAKLKGVVRPDGSVTAGNASGVNDGAARCCSPTRTARSATASTPRARVLGLATAGVRAARDGHRAGAGDAEAARRA